MPDWETTPHRIAQKEARERKHEKKLAAEEASKAAYKAASRRIHKIELKKADLLSLLIKEGLVTDDATRILGTGHYPDKLVFEVTFDNDD